MDLQLNFEEEEIFNNNDRLIHFVINKYFLIQEDGFVDRNDLYQLGSIGLIKAIKNFNPEFGTQLSTYAVPKIYGEIKRYFRDNGRYVKIPRKIKTIYDKLIRKNIDFNKLDFKEVMEEYDLTEDDTSLLIKYLNSQFISKDSEYKYFDNEKTLFGDMIADDRNDIDSLINEIELEKRLSILSKRDREIVKLSLQGIRQRDIGLRFNISQVHVSRIISKSVNKINEQFDKAI